MLNKRCEHTKEDSWWEVDGRNIPLARVCGKCKDEVLSKYNPRIFEYYSQADTDERIEEDY